MSAPTSPPPSTTTTSSSSSTRLIEPYFDKATVNTLLQMGFTRNRAIRGLYATGGYSADDAMMWLISNENDPHLDEPLLVPAPTSTFVPAASTTTSSSSTPNLALSDVDIGLATAAALAGREISTAEESSLKSLISSFIANDTDQDDTKSQTTSSEEPHKLVLCVRQDLGMSVGKIAAQCAHAALGAYLDITEHKSHDASLREWLHQGQAKIVVAVPTEEQMRLLESTSRALDLPTHVVHDAGRTEIVAGSATVLAIGPAPNHLIDPVTKHLKLLK